MPIDFSCTGCAKLLRVSDESAGKDARCPDCGAINRVPAAGAAPFAPLGAPPPQPEKQDWLFNEAGSAPASSNPFGAAATANPYAAPQASAYAPAYPSLPIQPTVVSVEPIMNYAWEIWKQNLGLLVGTTVTIFVVNWVLSFIVQMAQFAIAQNNNAQEVAVGVGVVGGLLNNAVQFYLSIGQTQIALKLVRRQPAEFTDLFGGGAVFLPALGTGLLMGIAVFVGLLLLIVPGVLLALMWWPTYYLVVDQKTRVIEAFTVASSITKGNWGTAFLLWLLSIAIMFAGLLALCIGVIFAAPLVTVLFTTAYLMMAGQLSVYPQQPQYPAYGK
jgi:hypothetical protein